MNDKIGDERRGSRQDGIFLLRLTNDHQIGQSRVRSQRLSCGTLDAAPFPLNAFLRQAINWRSSFSASRTDCNASGEI